MDVRKTSLTRETVFAEAGRAANRPTTRAAAIAVITNPYAGQFVEDLSLLFDWGAELGERLMGDLVALLPHPAVAYGKAAIVGVHGEPEHGAAMVHPRLGKPMRQAVGGGEALICSNVKVAAAGASIDVPLAHKDNIWSFEHFDTFTLCVSDAPRPDEILVVMAVSDGSRPHPRVGKGRIL